MYIKKKKNYVPSFSTHYSYRFVTCDNIEALLSLDEGDVIGYEGGVCIRLHAGMSGLLQLHTPGAVRQQARSNIRHRSRNGHHSETRHRVQLRYHVAQRLEGIHVTWSSNTIHREMMQQLKPNLRIPSDHNVIASFFFFFFKFKALNSLLGYVENVSLINE